MMKGGHGQTNQLHDINWGALDHASCAPQLMPCDYYVCVCACTRAREQGERDMTSSSHPGMEIGHPL